MTNMPTLKELKWKMLNSALDVAVFEYEHYQYRSIIGGMHFQAFRYFPDFRMLSFTQEFRLDNRYTDKDYSLSFDMLLELIAKTTKDLDADNLQIFAMDIDFWGRKDNIRVLKEIRKQDQKLQLLFSYADE